MYHTNEIYCIYEKYSVFMKMHNNKEIYYINKIYCIHKKCTTSTKYIVFMENILHQQNILYLWKIYYINKIYCTHENYVVPK